MKSSFSLRRRRRGGLKNRAEGAKKEISEVSVSAIPPKAEKQGTTTNSERTIWVALPRARRASVGVLSKMSSDFIQHTPQIETSARQSDGERRAEGALEEERGRKGNLKKWRKKFY